MTDERIGPIADDVKYIRTRLDQHIHEHAKDRLEIENRLTSVERASGLWGVLGGILAAVGIHIARRP